MVPCPSPKTRLVCTMCVVNNSMCFPCVSNLRHNSICLLKAYTHFTSFGKAKLRDIEVFEINTPAEEHLG